MSSCKISYDKSNEKVSLFSIPKCLLRGYNHAIPRKDRSLTERGHIAKNILTTTLSFQIFTNACISNLTSQDSFKNAKIENCLF